MPSNDWINKPVPRWFAIITSVAFLLLTGSEVWLHLQDTGINNRLLNLEESKMLPEKIFLYDTPDKTTTLDELFSSDIVFEYKGYNTVYYCVEWEVTNAEGTKDFVTPLDFSQKNPRCSWISSGDPKTASKQFKFVKEGKYKIKAYVYYNKDIEGENDSEKLKYLKESIARTGDVAGKYETQTYFVQVTEKT